ncbi:uncharacterized protein [Dermacentor albipictus]|uniref:uncharacterized protein n=1 Tax=Dermacentor albipictus TaxID=60249 RepID=UPI0038FC2E23
MAKFKLNDMPQEYFQYMLDIMHKEGHHYFYHDDAQYRDGLKVEGPDELFVGFTIRLFLYNKDQSGSVKLGAEWKSKIGQAWRIAAEFGGKAIWYVVKTRYDIYDSRKKAKDLTVPDNTLYSLAIRVKTDSIFETLKDDESFYEIDMGNILKYTWYFHIKVVGQVLLGMSITSETASRPDDAWGRRCCLWDLELPVGAIGVYTCELVDNTKKNWIQLTDPKDKKSTHYFDHGNLSNGTILHYTIRLSFREYVVSTDFHPELFTQQSDKPTYINAYFSEALNIINFDVDVPYT